MSFEPIFLTLKLAIITTLVLFIIGVPLSHWLAHSKWRYKVVVEAIVSLPLVLPPTVLGFYLLIAFSPNSFIGHFLDHYFDLKLVFSFPGLVIGSVIYSLPFMIQPLKAGFTGLPKQYRETAFVLGKSKFKTLTKVELPNMKDSVLVAAILTFAHTVGEFGVVLMIGGNIPGKTKVVSVAIYDEVEALNYQTAHWYALSLLGVTFLALIWVYAKRKSITQF